MKKIIIYLVIKIITVILLSISKNIKKLKYKRVKANMNQIKFKSIF